MPEFMIRNSDVLFGRTVATYKFADRETIRRAIAEVSSLQVLGIDKRIHQVLYEKGHIAEDQIYAVTESLLHSHQIKKIPLLQAYLFTADDEDNLYHYLGLPKNFYRAEMLELPRQVCSSALPIAPENLLLCLNIKYSLAKAGIHVNLLNIIGDKKLLNANFLKMMPDLGQKKRTIISPKGRTKTRVRKSIAMLFSQIAILNQKMTPEQFQLSYAMWEKVTAVGLDLRYSEILFYMGYLDPPSLNKIAAFLANISQIDQYPRFALFCLKQKEQHFFDKLCERKVFRADLMQRATEILYTLHTEGLDSIHLSDILILQGYLSRQKIAIKWEELHKKEIAEQVKQVQMERTEETHIQREEAASQLQGQLHEELLESQEILKNAENEINAYYKTTENFVEEARRDGDKFEKELKKAFRNTQQIQRKALKLELENLKGKLGKADKEELKTLNTVIGHYLYYERKLKFYLLLIGLFLFMMLLGFFFAYFNN